MKPVVLTAALALAALAVPLSAHHSWTGEYDANKPRQGERQFWLDSAGTPHTEQLHLIERYTRTDYNTLQRVVTIDDPGTFTKPFDVTYTAKLGEPDREILEYFCIENNQWGERGNADPTAPSIPVAK